MNIFRKLMSAFQGGAREAAEVVIDANGLRILGQEIHECEQDVTSSKQKLALIIAEKMQVKRDIETLTEKNIKLEGEIANFLEQAEEEQALNLAQQLAEIEPKLLQKKEHFDKLKSHEMALQGSLKKTILGLESFKSEYKMAKATDNFQKAQSTFSGETSPNSRFNDMKESLERIQEKQQGSADRMDARGQVEEMLDVDPLDVKTDTAAPSAEDILQRIKDKQSA